MTYWEDNRPGPESPIDGIDSETLVEMAASAVHLLSHVDLLECPDDARSNTGWLISTILETVSWRTIRESYAKDDKREAEQREEERHREAVAAYFNPDNSEVARAKMEGLVSDDDIAAELDSMKGQEEIFSVMAKRVQDRFQLVNKLQTKRAEAVEGEMS